MIAGKSDSTASRIFISSVAADSNDRSSKTSRSSRREKCVLESWLERAELSFANTKPRADLRLGCAKKFDLDLAGFVERVAHGLERERGRIAIAAEMAEHDTIDFSRKQFFDHGGGCVIGEMSVSRLNPLFHRPGPMRIVLQEFFVVVCFDDQGMNLPKPFHDHFGRVTEIGDESETARSGMKHKTDRIDRVVRHGKRLHENVANLELGAGAKDSPVPMLVQGSAAAHRFGGLRIRVNRNV